MHDNYIARSAITINAPSAKVWHALVTPDAIKQYMFGSIVASDWKPGSSITWKGSWNGKTYEDKGKIIRLVPERNLQYTHFSPLAGLPDKPENYHTVTIELAGVNGQTRLSLTQDNNSTEEARRHSEQNWELMLTGLKQLVER